MQWGSALALAGLLIGGTASAANGESHRLYDRDADCAVFGVAGFAAIRASWDGPCTRGLATGQGTAVFFDKDGKSEAINAGWRDGAILDGDAEIRWSDGARYTGTTAEGRPNGHGAVVWANGDRYEGDWVNGKAEGRGVQTWANGDSYDGAWRDDQPNGEGTVTHKDGTHFVAHFIDGKRQETDPPKPVAAATPSPAATPAPADAPPALLDGFTGKTLIGVDGSSVTLTAKTGGVLRTITNADGSTQLAAFTFLGNGLGTISDGGNVTGFFRVSASSVELTYGDGRSESVRLLGDGIVIVAKDAAGAQSCSAWYPQGHAFSAEERKAAVAAYARRLGVAGAGAVPMPCPSAVATPAHTLPMPKPGAPRKPLHAAREPLAIPASNVTPSGLTMVPVKPSTVHLIDGGPEVVPVDAAAIVDEKIASNCLKVESDGAYWGFRNHCGYSVQFAYCLLRGVDPMTACGGDGAASVPGSVAASGFGALFSDQSIAERDVERAFRWVGCRGGAGEVAAHLDHAEPASGRCTRAGQTASRDN